MKKSIEKYIKYIGVTFCISTAILSFTGCGDKPEIPAATFSYGEEIGIANGNVDLSGEEPVINISDIKSPAGENIDFLSGVTIANEEDFEDLSVYTDASFVDIFTPGDYKATYTFNYNGKSVSKEVTVTIFEPDGEPSASDSSTDEGMVEKPTPTTTTNNNADNEPTSSQGTTKDTDKPTVTETTTKNPSRPTETTTKNSSRPTETTTKNNKPTTPPATTTKKDSQETTSREMITTTGNKTTENKYIGNYTIELLSGKTITIKNSTSKYIVSTRTDISTVSKRGHKYKVSKLVIRYNTGAEQILEVIEERLD